MGMTMLSLRRIVGCCCCRCRCDDIITSTSFSVAYFRAYIKLKPQPLLFFILLILPTASVHRRFAIEAAAITVQESSKSTIVTAAFCQWEMFNATCPTQDQVVVIMSGQYGRMQIGRCVTRNYGFIGCSADVFLHLTSLCSGRHSCRFLVPDETLRDIRPCPKDFASYLLVTYRCVKVVTGYDSPCYAWQPIPVDTTLSNHGYLASVITDRSGRGSAECPWLLTAQPGQRINITLLNFATASGSASRNSGSLLSTSSSSSILSSSTSSHISYESSEGANPLTAENMDANSQASVHCEKYATIRDRLPSQKDANLRIHVKDTNQVILTNYKQLINDKNKSRGIFDKDANIRSGRQASLGQNTHSRKIWKRSAWTTSGYISASRRASSDRETGGRLLSPVGGMVGLATSNIKESYGIPSIPDLPGLVARRVQRDTGEPMRGGVGEVLRGGDGDVITYEAEETFICGGEVARGGEMVQGESSGGGQGEGRVVYTSRSNEVEVAVIAHALPRRPARFLLRYEVVGCRTLPAPVNGWVERIGSDDVIWTGCNDSLLERRYMRCVGTRWTGNYTNCTSAQHTGSAGWLSGPNDWSSPLGILLVSSIGVALGIVSGTFLLIIVVIAFKRDSCLDARDVKSTEDDDQPSRNTPYHPNPPQQHPPPPPRPHIRHHPHHRQQQAHNDDVVTLHSCDSSSCCCSCDDSADKVELVDVSTSVTSYGSICPYSGGSPAAMFTSIKASPRQPGVCTGVVFGVKTGRGRENGGVEGVGGSLRAGRPASVLGLHYFEQLPH